MSAVAVTVVMVAAGCTPTGTTTPQQCQYSPPPPTSPSAPATVARPGRPTVGIASTDVVFKLADSSPAIDGVHLVDSTGVALTGVNAALDAANVSSLRTVFDDSAAPELGGYVRATTASFAAADALVATLATRADVLDAYRAAEAAPPPATPCFASHQKYFGGAPDGLGIQAARTWPGATGANVTVIDVEYSWNVSHEDLSAARKPNALLAQGIPVDPFSDDNHGTAVVGILAGDPNAYGVNGIVPDATLHLVNASQLLNGYQPAVAIAAAAAALQPGDVIVLEQQNTGPNGELVPAEWVPEVYDAIVAATAAGIIVVEAAGNGGVDLDDPTYGASFPSGKADSGAIVVGAGAACGALPERSRMYFSDYGQRVDVQAEGECVASSGFGTLYSGGPNATYTDGFNGTSSATALIGGVSAALSSAWQQERGTAPTPATIRNLLIASGVAQDSSISAGHIGPRPNLSVALGLIATWVE